MIDTARLCLRAPRETDRSQLVALLRDPGFMEFTVSGALSERAANARFDRMVETAASLPFAKRPIIAKATGDLVGYAGLDRLLLDGVEQIELGYRLVASARGQGYATEACAALLEQAAQRYDGEVVAIIEPANASSARVVTKLGFHHRGRSLVHATDFDVYSRPFRAGPGS